MKVLLPIVLATCFLLGACAFTERQKVDQLQTIFRNEAAGKVAARYYEALAADRDAEFWSLMAPFVKQGNPGLRAALVKNGESAMRGFTKWSSSPSISTVKNLDATAEFPGPFYIVERTAEFDDGSTYCFIAIVEFDRGGTGYVSSLHGAKTRGEARKRMLEASKNAG